MDDIRKQSYRERLEIEFSDKLDPAAQPEKYGTDAPIMLQRVADHDPQLKEYLAALINGKTQKGIADQLGVSTRTLRRYNHRIRELLSQK